jgi:alpha-glucosidase
MLLDSGVRAIWNDMNEPAMSTAPFGEPGQAGQIPSDAPQGSQEERTTHAEVHNLFGYLMSRSTFEGLLRLRPDERPFVLTRSGFAGIQKYAAVWMGDNLAVWEHLEMSMPQLCNMGLSGVPFTGVDIGGFSFGSSAELFARWIELGAFYPFSRAHSAEGTPQKEPWVFGEQVEAISRKYLELRYRFMPYLYTAFWQNSQSGAPVFRPMLYHFWQDPATLELNDQVMVGEGLMLAPVYRPGLNYRSVYLPAGVWYDWWSGPRFEGSEGRVIIAAAPLDTMPIYVRGGSILSLGPVMQYTDEKSLDLLTLEIFPDEQGNATGQLYDDDGLSFAYRQGQSRLTRYECRPNGAKTVVIARHEGAYQPASRSIEIRLHLPDGSVRTTHHATDDGDWEVEV